jgi:hypothetical protein
MPSVKSRSRHRRTRAGVDQIDIRSARAGAVSGQMLIINLLAVVGPATGHRPPATGHRPMLPTFASCYLPTSRRSRLTGTSCSGASRASAGRWVERMRSLLVPAFQARRMWRLRDHFNGLSDRVATFGADAYAAAAMAEFHGTLAVRRSKPGRDVMTDLVRAQADDEPAFEEPEMVRLRAPAVRRPRNDRGPHRRRAEPARRPRPARRVRRRSRRPRRAHHLHRAILARRTAHRVHVVLPALPDAAPGRPARRDRGARRPGDPRRGESNAHPRGARSSIRTGRRADVAPARRPFPPGMFTPAEEAIIVYARWSAASTPQCRPTSMP